MSRSRLGGLLLVAAVLIAGLIIWSKVRFVFFIRIDFWGFALLSLGLVVVIYLILRTLLRK